MMALYTMKMSKIGRQRCYDDDYDDLSTIPLAWGDAIASPKHASGVRVTKNALQTLCDQIQSKRKMLGNRKHSGAITSGWRAGRSSPTPRHRTAPPPCVAEAWPSAVCPEPLQRLWSHDTAELKLGVDALCRRAMGLTSECPRCAPLSPERTHNTL